MKHLEAKPVVTLLQSQLKENVAAFQRDRGRAPKLSVVLIGEDTASVIYTKKKSETAIKLGFLSDLHRFKQTENKKSIRSLVEKLNQDPTVDGILIQRPAPIPESELVWWVRPEKDVDGLHPESVGKLVLGLPTFCPCTPLGIMRLLDYYKIPIAQKNACIIGRSAIVGKPMAALLTQANATVTVAHSQTQNLPSITKQADLLIVAIGKAGFITSEHVKPGSVVIDVGINRHTGNNGGKITGDVDFSSVEPIVSAITPVPGGVGPMTITMLLSNTLLAAQNRQKIGP